MKTILVTIAFIAISFATLVPTQAQCVPTDWNLTAGQHIYTGSVSVENDTDNVYVTYTIDTGAQPDATFGTLHVWVGNDMGLMPQTGGGAPIPGQFCSADGGACFDATGLSTYEFTIPFSDLNIVDVSNANDLCGETLFVVTHAEVNNVIDENGETNDETAFGGDEPGPGNRWWFYGEYVVCCEDPGDPPTVDSCETAYAKGSHVWTTGRKSNPENLPSLRLTRNRWGWAIKLCTTATSTYDIWAGAGLNDASKGSLVGTLTVGWDGTSVSVTYDMLDGYNLEEVHIWAKDAEPDTIAPGQYGNIAEFDPNVTTYTFASTVEDTDLDGCIWIVAHAVACSVQQ
jgi:hypothetical protein